MSENQPNMPQTQADPIQAAPDAQATDVVIVGAGPAGLMAAIAAAEAGARVVLCEQLDRPGAKLLATGGGRCNMTNTLEAEAFMARFGREGRFMQPTLSHMDSPGLREFFNRLGVRTTSPDGVQVYPVSNSAATVQKALLRRCGELGVSLRCGVCITGLTIVDGAVAGLETSQGPIAAQRVVLATGGKSYSALGATGSGYELARQAGHTIIEPLPALVPLVLQEAWPRACAGVSLSPARVWIDLPKQSKAGVTGDVLITHTGLSGPAVLDLSTEVSALLQHQPTVPIRLDLVPYVPADRWQTRFDQWQRTHGTSLLRTQLAQYIPASLAQSIYRRAGLGDHDRVAHLSRAQRDALVGLLTALPLTVIGTEGFDKAIITRGGVSLRQVSPAQLQSKLVKGLFFAGELLDLAGPCGGYNLQWAFSSGHLAGLSAARGRVHELHE